MGIMDKVLGLFGSAAPQGDDAASPRSMESEGKPVEDNVVEKLTTKEHQLWKSRLKRSRDMHMPYWLEADNTKSEYLGRNDPRFDSSSAKGRPVNLVASFINTAGPLVLPKNAMPIVEPSGEGDGDEAKHGADLLEARMRQVFQRVPNYRALRRATFDAFFFAGYVLTGWRAAGSNAAVRSDGGDGVPSSGLNAKMPHGPVDEPYFRHIKYRNVLIDPDSEDFDRARWKCYMSAERIKDLQANDDYHDTDRLLSGRDDDTEDNEGGEGRSAEDRIVTVYTVFHEGRRPGETGVLILAGASYVEIRHYYTEFGAPGMPLQRLCFHDVSELMPANPIQFWIDLHDSYNEFVAEATERASQAKSIVVVPDTEMQDKIVNVAGSDVIVADGGSSDYIKNIDIGGSRPDTWQAMSLYERTVDKVSGISDFQRGVPTPGGKKTAREVSEMTNFTQTRLGDYRGSINDFLRLVALDMGGFLLKHQWQDVPVKLDRGGGKIDFDMFSQSAVYGDLKAYELVFDVADVARVDPVIQQKRAQDMVQILANPDLQMMARQEGKMFSPVAAVEDLLKALGIRDIDRYVKDVPSPEEQAMQSEQFQQMKALQENQVLEAGQYIPVDVENDDHAVHGQVHEQVDTPEAAEHIAEHYAALEAMSRMPSQVPQGSTQVAPGQMPQPRSGRNGSMLPEDSARLSVNAGNVQ